MRIAIASWRERRLEALARIAAGAILLFASTVGGWAAETIKTDQLPGDTLIVLRRGACEHRCAVYNVIIFADGSAIFDGRHYVRRASLIKTKIPLEELGRLLGEAAALGFFEMPARYEPNAGAGCSSSKSDAPVAILSISTGGKSHTVVHYLGCEGSESERLARFEEQIDRAVNAAQWVR